MHRNLQKLTAESADMSAVVSSDGVYRYVSPAARRLLGWDPAEIEGHHEDEFVHPEDLPSLLASRSVSAPEGAGVMYRFRCADGSYLWVEATSRTVEADGSTFVVASTWRGQGSPRRWPPSSTLTPFLGTTFRWR
jgi:PAS domain S-box-containing protein